MAQGERLVSVGVVSVEPAAAATVVKAAALTTMPRPIAGIEQVANAADLIPRQRAETDDELRARARVQARSANTGTVAALEQAVRSLGLTEVKVLEFPADPALLPGQIQVVVGDPGVSDEVLQQVADRIEQVRPVGIVVGSGAATRVWAQITATLTLDVDRTERERKAIESKLCADLIAWFGQLAVGEGVHQAKVRAILSGNDAVVGCEATTGFAGLLEPFVRIDGKLVSQSSRYLLNVGDIQIGPRDRIALLPAELPIRLTLQGPAPTVSVDIAIELVAGSDATGVAERLKTSAGRIVADAIKIGGIEFDPLKSAIDLIVAPAKQARLRVTVVHESDGRVVELSADQLVEALAAREAPRLRNTPVSVRT
jgi:hypothetical protein